MARIYPSSLINSFSGRLSGSVFERSHGVNFIRTHISAPLKSKSQKQYSLRGIRSTLSGLWFPLSPSIKSLWRSYSVSSRSASSGYHSFLDINTRLCYLLGHNSYRLSPPPFPSTPTHVSGISGSDLSSGSFNISWSKPSSSSTFIFCNYRPVLSHYKLISTRWKFGFTSDSTALNKTLNTGYESTRLVDFRLRSFDSYGRVSPFSHTFRLTVMPPAGLFVAVASTGTHRVMTSTNGTTWTMRNASEANDWRCVTYGKGPGVPNGLFVAVCTSGAHKIMTSPDGVTWTSCGPSIATIFYGVCYGIGSLIPNGLFVAVGWSGDYKHIITSPDGINWTIRTGCSYNGWRAICYSKGLFVACGYTGAAVRIMTSPDGISWTLRFSSSINSWQAINYGIGTGVPNGLFVTVANVLKPYMAMCSFDGITWSNRDIGSGNKWSAICYGNNLFVTVAYEGLEKRIRTSSNGVTWIARDPAEINSWFALAYGNNLFVCLSIDGTHQLMTSSDGIYWISGDVPEPNAWRFLTYSVL